MLTYYPEYDYYYCVSSNGFALIDRDSHAFDFCEYLRSTNDTKEIIDFDGEYCLQVLVTEYRVDQIKEFVILERLFTAIMRDGE